MSQTFQAHHNKSGGAPSRYDQAYIFSLLLVVVLFLVFFRLGSLTLFDVDEAVFSQASKEMVQSGDWITPTYNGVNRYDKPILFYWLMGASYKIFGFNEFGARFPSAVCGFLLSLALFLFTRRCYGGKRALFTVLSFVLSLYFFAYSHAAVTDMTLTLFITLSVLSFYLSLAEDRRYIYGFYLGSALALLTKGLIGIVFPFGIAIIYLLVTRNFSFRKIFDLKGAALFLAAALPWHAAELAINGREFIEQFFIKHHLMRYTGVISGHKGPVYYYLPLLLLGLFPWVAFLPSGMRRALEEKGKDNLGILACIWFLFVVVFFSFSTTKLPNYILPALPAAALLIGSGLTDANTRWSRASSAFAALTALLIGGALVMSKSYLTAAGFAFSVWLFVAAGIMLVMALLNIYSLYKGGVPFPSLSVLMLVFLIILSTTALPAANSYLQGALHKYSLLAKDRLPADDKVVTYGINSPSVVFYSGHRVITAGGKDAIVKLMNERERLLVIAKAKEIGALESLGLHLLDKDGTYALLEKN